MEFSFGASASKIINSTGFSGLEGGDMTMLLVACVLIYLAIWKKFEPLLLLPMGFGALLANIPMSMMASTDTGGLLNFFYQGIKHEILPPLIFLGVGALTDFGPLLANPATLLLGAAAQIGVYVTLIGAVLLGFNMHEASAIGIIGGADGPTSIFIASKLAPHLLAPIAVAAYSYMSLVPLIQPPIMKLLTTAEERKIKMEQLKPISQTVKIVFPVVVTIVCCLMLPGVTPLLGMLMLGNMFRESGVTARLHETAETHLINIVTILLALAVGSSMTADSFLRFETLKIIVLGLLAFCIATVGGVVFGKIMCKLTGGRVNPLIGSAGVSAVPMAARVSQKVGAEADSSNFLLMHAMGPNVAGVIGSAVAAGVFISLFGDTVVTEPHAAIVDVIGSAEFSPPSLNTQGRKTQPDWLFKFFNGPTTIRPNLQVRMPSFNMTDDQWNSIIRSFQFADDQLLAYETDHSISWGRKIKAGEKLASTDFGACDNCHFYGSTFPIQGAQAWAPNLAMAKDRLRADWIVDWLKDPMVIMPGTKMPAPFLPTTDLFEDDDASNIYGEHLIALDGDTTAMLEGIRDFIWAMKGQKDISNIVKQYFDENGYNFGEEESDEEDEWDDDEW